MNDGNNQDGYSNSIPFPISPMFHPGITSSYEIGNNSLTSVPHHHNMSFFVLPISSSSIEGDKKC